jgi:hypothetical protein
MALDDAPVRQRLVAAVVDGTDDDVPMLRVLAVAESYPDRIDVIATVRAAMLPRLLEFYAAAAVDSYRAVAKEFDRVGHSFTTAAKQCDPEAGGSAVVGLADKVRTSWHRRRHSQRPDPTTETSCRRAPTAATPSPGRSHRGQRETRPAARLFPCRRAARVSTAGRS